VCVCPEGFTLCGSECVDLTLDPAHCGQCNLDCGDHYCKNSICAYPIDIATADDIGLVMLMNTGDVIAYLEDRYSPHVVIKLPSNGDAFSVEQSIYSEDRYNSGYYDKIGISANSYQSIRRYTSQEDPENVGLYDDTKSFNLYYYANASYYNFVCMPMPTLIECRSSDPGFAMSYAYGDIIDVSNTDILLNDTLINFNPPALTTVPTNYVFKDIATTPNKATRCGITATGGQMYCKGTNTSGLFGDGTGISADSYFPIQTPEEMVAIDFLGSKGYGLSVTHKMYTWAPEAMHVFNITTRHITPVEPNISIVNQNGTYNGTFKGALNRYYQTCNYGPEVVIPFVSSTPSNITITTHGAYYVAIGTTPSSSKVGVTTYCQSESSTPITVRAEPGRVYYLRLEKNRFNTLDDWSVSINGLVPPECYADTSCLDGKKCFNGVCQAANFCFDDDDCQDNYTCENSACAIIPSLTPTQTSIRNGSLTSTDNTDSPRGASYYTDKYTYHLAAGCYLIDVTNNLFDDYFILTQHNSVMSIADVDTGRYRFINSTHSYYDIYVTSYSARQTGDYTLSVTPCL
jgi:hypothetical protein